MPFVNPQQRAAFFAKQKLQNPMGTPMQNPLVERLNTVSSNTPPPSAGLPGAVKIQGTPKGPRFGRVRKMFKI